VIANQYEWTAFGREVTRRSGPTISKIQIKRPTELSQNETDLALEGLLRNASAIRRVYTVLDLPSSDLEFF